MSRKGFAIRPDCRFQALCARDEKYGRVLAGEYGRIMGKLRERGGALSAPRFKARIFPLPGWDYVRSRQPTNGKAVGAMSAVDAALQHGLH